MRSMWKGAISFGLVNIPVKLYTATEHQDIRFRYLHNQCLAPIRYEKKCEHCNQEVQQADLVRGYEYAKGQFVIINQDDLDNLAVKTTKTIDIIDFVDQREIDPIYYDKTYFLEAEETGGKAYQLLKKAMLETNKIAIAKVVIRTKQVLAIIRVYQDALAMGTIFYPAEIRSHLGLATGSNSQIAAKELNMAISLIESLSVPFEPEKYTDDYRQSVLDLIEQKISGNQTVVPVADVQPAKVVDLMEALEASLKAAEKQTMQLKKTRQKQEVR